MQDVERLLPYVFMLMGTGNQYLPYIMLIVYIYNTYYSAIILYFRPKLVQFEITENTTFWWKTNDMLKAVNYYILKKCDVKSFISSEVDEIGDVPNTRMRMYRPVIVPDGGTYCVIFNKAPITIYKTYKTVNNNNNNVLKEFITLSAKNKDILLEFLQQCQEYYIAGQIESTNMDTSLVYEEKTGWIQQSINVVKTFDNVVLTPQIRTTIRKALDDFMQQKFREVNTKLGAPNKIAWLFYGPPGCGKSSTLYLIARYTKMPIVTVPPLSSMTLKEMAQMLRSIPRKVIVHFEEIDCDTFLHKRVDNNSDYIDSSETSEDDDNSDDDNADKLPTPHTTKSARPSNEDHAHVHLDNSTAKLKLLLEYLDGYTSLNDSIVIMTTNRPEVLDPALVRPGRIDYKIEFAVPQESDISTVFPDLQFNEDETMYEGFLRYRSHLINQ